MPSQVAKVETLVQDALSKGARLMAGGHRNASYPKAQFFEPTVLVDCTHDMRIVNEEAFGPTMLVLKWHSDEEVIEYANSTGITFFFLSLSLSLFCFLCFFSSHEHTEYGLSSSIFSTNYKRAEAMGQQIIAGSVCNVTCTHAHTRRRTYLPLSRR